MFPGCRNPSRKYAGCKIPNPLVSLRCSVSKIRSLGPEAMAAGPDVRWFSRTQHQMHIGNAFRNPRQQGDYALADILSEEERIPIDFVASDIFIVDVHEMHVGEL
jgi:hypothetical protein